MRAVVSAVVLSFLVTSTAFAQLVTRVVDGDTIVVAGVGTVRLIGVDTAETVDPRKPVQFFGKEASDFTRRMAQGQVVRLEFDYQRTDKYQRTLSYAFLSDGTFLNAEIVKQGYGQAYVKYPFKYLDQFRIYEREAREARRGLWGAQPDAAGARAVSGVEDRVDPEQLVYVTRTGTKYHREGCRSLSRSQIPMRLKDVGSHTACSICKPPTLPDSASGTAHDASGAAAVASPRSAPAQPVEQGRCQDLTKKGTQCSRKAQAGSTYCWQHQH
jgi:micrococcal nuclease